MRRRETAADEPTRRRDAAATDQGASTDQYLSLVTDTDAALEEDQLVIEVEGPITIETDHFRFARTFEGFEVVPQKGTLIGHDGDREVRTPFDDCVMVMPSREPLKGKTAVRLGRIV